jgi:hypothetical protein
MQPPDRPLPAPGPQILLQPHVIRRNRDDAGPVNGSDRLTKIPGRQQPVRPILPVKQHNIHVAMKLAMLEPIVKQMHNRFLLLTQNGNRQCVPFGQKSRFEALCGHVNRNARLARDQERLVAELLRASTHLDQRSNLALPPIASGEHVHVEVALRERLCQCNCQGGLSRAARGEVPDAYDRPSQSAHRFRSGSQPALPQP